MSSKKSELRLRVFAGPNGSGKSAIINQVRITEVNGFPIDIGIYINADDIAKSLVEDTFDFNDYDVTVTKKPLLTFTESSGLLNDEFDINSFAESLSVYKGRVKLSNEEYVDRNAQIIARFLRERMLVDRKRFSFETVFSHESNIEIMQRARESGYKVYLYFVATEDPEINKYRVKLRVAQGGHDVPPNKIESRYFRSLENLFDAAEQAYQCYFFDNSYDSHKLVNHFKVIGDVKKWDTKNTKDFPVWFKKYYWDKYNL